MPDAPKEFQAVFRDLVAVFPTRGLLPGTLQAYYTVLEHVPLTVLQASARALAETGRYFPSASEWLDATRTIAQRPYPAEGSRRLEELDALAPNDPERDEVCKGLSLDDQRALMARYGLPWK